MILRKENTQIHKHHVFIGAMQMPPCEMRLQAASPGFCKCTIVPYGISQYALYVHFKLHNLIKSSMFSTELEKKSQGLY